MQQLSAGKHGHLLIHSLASFQMGRGQAIFSTHRSRHRNTGAYQAGRAPNNNRRRRKERRNRMNATLETEKRKEAGVATATVRVVFGKNTSNVSLNGHNE